MNAHVIQPVPDYWYNDFLQEKKFPFPVRSTDPSSMGVPMIVEFKLEPDANDDVTNPEDVTSPEEVFEMLKSEKPPARIWNLLALHYLVHQREDVFCQILEQANQNFMYQMQHKDSQEDLIDMAFCLDLLANYYALKSTKETGDRKKELMSKATVLYTHVDRMAIYNQYHLVGRAYFCVLDPEKMEQAKTQFDFVLKSWPNDPLALQGRGIVAFHQQDYKLALQQFRRLLSAYPQCSADVRMAIGHCLFKLGRYDKAKMAYRQALEIDRTCVGANVGCAVVLLNEGTPASIFEAGKMIGEVYKLDRSNPINLNLLADHFFYRRETEKAINLSTVAFQTSYSDTLKAESAYMLGRSFHYKEDFDQAFQYYYQATQFAKATFVLPWYGLGQMYIQRGDNKSATQCFEKVLAQSPNNVETLKILGLLYLTTGEADKREKAKGYLKKVTELCPDDIDAHMKFAELQEGNAPRSALNTYLRVLEIYNERSSQDDAPAELFNNISVLYFYLNEIPNSRKFLEMAKARAEEAQKEVPDGHYGALLTTMTYNQGRLAEEARDFKEARECYDSILKKNPSYLDCYLRHGCMERDRGFFPKAADWFKLAGSVGQDHPVAQLLFGNLHMSRAEYVLAQKKYEKVLTLPKSKTDTYAMLSLGNIWLESLYMSTADPEKKKRHVDRAYDFYKQVLHVDPFNIYAVNGLGALLARIGQTEEAKEMFAVVRESSADILDLWLNIGHQYCEAKQYVAGMKMYENALRRFKDAQLDPQIHLYLARAQYFNGDLKDARRTLQLARHLVPQNSQVRYNLAIVMKRMAVTTLKDSRAELYDVMGAIADLKGAEEMFENLALETDKSFLIDPTKASEQARMCSDYKNQADYHLDRAKETDAAQKLTRQKVEEARLAYQKRVQEESVRKEEEKLKEQEDLMKKRQEVLNRALEVKEKLLRSATEDAVVRPRKRTKKHDADDGFVNDGDVYEDRPGEPSRKRSKHDSEGRKKRLAGRKKREDQREGEIGSDSDEEKGKDYDPYAGPKGKRYLTKETVSDTDTSSSSEGEDDGGGKSKKDTVASSDDEGNNLPSGRDALASSDEEKETVKKKARVMDSDEEETEKAQEKSSPKKVRALASSDEETEHANFGMDMDKGGNESDDEPKRSKLSLNDSGSE
ncbi:RNA polymerase-associated protein CTR9 homolog [Paramacrobiotus metropolitanus]|uniref:RNA polymerase-associated protein CTR9 homolog n=1 Tax=Paramacrobiotus metropolitanus TaxID=2943436 RepID=UPI0024461045|nr:RNA polymerase-associated protein CTR9 homolog [Paramacrobiotus metropolitanus]